MSKIQKITIQNFKAVEAFEADFKGCTAIITGGNNKGKSSLLRGIPDRVRFVRPDVMVKDGATQGKGEMTLDSGEKFLWEFDSKGKDKLTYVTSKGVKASVTKELGATFFPAMFDIDKFLQSSPKDQSKQLQKIVGIDFSDIDSRYKIAYDDRTDKNREAERFHAKLVSEKEVPKVDRVDLTALNEKREAEKNRLNQLYKDNQAYNAELKKLWIAAKDSIDVQVKEANDAERKRVNDLYIKNSDANNEARKVWNDAKLKILSDCNIHNEAQKSIRANYESCLKAAHTLINFGYEKEGVSNWLATEFVSNMADDKIASDLYPSEPEYLTEMFETTLIEPTYPNEPEYIQEMPDRANLDAIDQEILNASLTNQGADKYQAFIDYKKKVEAAQSEATQADEKVKNIVAERAKMIAGAKFPKGIAISEDGTVTVDNLPLDRNQISTSKIYIAGLRIAAMNLGEVKTLYFDASFLDRNSLSEIEVWASENDLQLLIERPDFDGGELRYEIIENEQSEYDVLKSIEKKWNDFESKVAEFYCDEDGEYSEDNPKRHGDLEDIGEAAATACGWL